METNGKNRFASQGVSIAQMMYVSKYKSHKIALFNSMKKSNIAPISLIPWVAYALRRTPSSTSSSVMPTLSCTQPAAHAQHTPQPMLFVYRSDVKTGFLSFPHGQLFQTDLRLIVHLFHLALYCIVYRTFFVLLRTYVHQVPYVLPQNP